MAQLRRFAHPSPDRFALRFHPLSRPQPSREGGCEGVPNLIHRVMMKKKNLHRGSTFDSFLKEEGIYDEVTLTVMKRVLAWQIAQVAWNRSEFRPYI